MALDPSIYGAIGNGVRSIADYDQQAQTQQANKLALLLNQAKFDEYGRARADENALRQVVSGFGEDDAANVNALLRAGRLTEAQGYQKSRADLGKVKADTGKVEADTAKTKADTIDKAFGNFTSQLRYVRDQPSAIRLMQAGYADPVIGPMMQRFGTVEQATAIPGDPQGFQNWLTQATEGVGKLRDLTHHENTLAETKANNIRVDERIKSEGAANRGVTMRGQNISRDAALQGGSVQIDGTGNMVVVPNKIIPGQPTQVSPVMAGGVPVKGKDAGAPKISAEVQRQIGGLASFDKTLTALEEAMKDFNPRSTDQLNTTKRAKIQSLSKQAQLDAKEAAALGALSGPDMALLEGILNDPTNLRGAVSGSAGIAAQIGEARSGNQRRLAALKEQYGDRAGADIKLGAPAAGGLSAAEQAELDQLRSRFKK